MEKNTFSVKAEINVNLTAQDVDDIMIAALEGGINYWCDRAEVVEEKRVSKWCHEQIARGGCLILHDAESEDSWELNLEKLLNGIKLWVEAGGYKLGAIENGEIDCYYIDADCADEIVQFALFGELVFG